MLLTGAREHEIPRPYARFLFPDNNFTYPREYEVAFVLPVMSVQLVFLPRLKGIEASEEVVRNGESGFAHFVTTEDSLRDSVADDHTAIVTAAMVLEQQ